MNIKNNLLKLYVLLIVINLLNEIINNNNKLKWYLKIIYIWSMCKIIIILLFILLNIIKIIIIFLYIFLLLKDKDQLDYDSINSNI